MVLRIVAIALGLLAAAPTAAAQRSTPLQFTAPGGMPSDQFGGAVAISGDTMVVGAASDDVGANTDQGSAHVYRWSGSGWSFETTLAASDGAAWDRFGDSVAIDGSTIVVGAPVDENEAGSAYVFVRAPGANNWAQHSKLVAPVRDAGDRFGISVAVCANTVAVGADGSDSLPLYADNGAVYVFVRSADGTEWFQQAMLTASDAESWDYLGLRVAISGDTLVAGTIYDDSAAGEDTGAAYVFARTPGSSAWTEQAKLTASDAQEGDRLGHFVTIAGDTVAAGAIGDDGSMGSAYVFQRAGGETTWTEQAKLVASDREEGGEAFGSAGWLSGSTLIVSARHDRVGSNPDQGSAYVFVRSAQGAQWTQQTKLVPPDGASGDHFGWSAAVAGDTVVVGSRNDDVGANADEGTAWVFSRVGETWIGPDLKVLASDGTANDQFGWSVAISEDTAVVGAWSDDVTGSDQGSAYVFVRSGGSWQQQAKLVASDGAANDGFGHTVAIDGDSAVIGTYDKESAYIFARSGTSWSQVEKLSAPDGSVGDNFGLCVAVSGEVVFVGAPSDDNGPIVDQGSVYVFSRMGSTWSYSSKLTANDGAANHMFGMSVALEGSTAVIGAVGVDNRGAAYVFARTGDSWWQQSKLVALDGGVSDMFGRAVAVHGATAVVGATGNDSMRGAAYVFLRTGDAWAQQAKLTAMDGGPNRTFGVSVAVWDDLALVGSQQDTIGPNVYQGSAHVFSMHGSTWTQCAKFVAPDGAPVDVFGWAVALSGGTALIGAPYDDMGAISNHGSAYSFDVSSDDFAIAHNESLGISYPSLAAAFLGAQPGNQIAATPAAFAEIGFLDTYGRSLGVAGTGRVRTPLTSILTLGGSSVLLVPPGEGVEIHGQLLTASGGSVFVSADELLLGSQGVMTARTESSLTIASNASCLQGRTRLEQGAALTFGGSVWSAGPLTAALNSAITAGGTFTSADTFTITSATISTPLFENRAAANIFGSSAVFGSYTNGAGAVTTIRSGTLFIFGSLTNNGIIIGAICSDCLATAPGLDVGGGLALGAGASLALPFAGSLVHIGGSFDCAIDSNPRFDLALATLQMEGSGAEQSLEVMSKDIGPSALGLDRTIPGHYPLGALHVGPAASTVRLVDNRDNDALGQGASEAVYVDELRIEAGSRLINTACRVYYRTLSNAGTVDVAANLVRIPPPCPQDLNQDGSINTIDLTILLGTFGQSVPPGTGGDINADGVVNTMDLTSLLGVFGHGCP